MTLQTDQNSGHGHVFPRPDGAKARCGGPGICPECSRDLARKHTTDDRSKDERLSVVPMTLRAARTYVKERHRHAKNIQGGLFAVGAALGTIMVGCAIVGMPVSRQLQDGATVEIRRVCTDGTRNACSFLYRVCVRIANAMGYRRVLTYTLESESGASLRGAGFKITKRTRAEHWSRKGRERDEQPLQHKFRWEAA